MQIMEKHGVKVEIAIFEDLIFYDAPDGFLVISAVGHTHSTGLSYSLLPLLLSLKKGRVGSLLEGLRWLHQVR
jgi:hypothetical protein